MTASERSTTSRHGDRLDLMAGFDLPAHEQWQRQVEQVLRKTRLLDRDDPAPEKPEDLLTTTTLDGITVAPLYAAATEQPETGYPGLAPFTRGTTAEGGTSGGWDVRQYHDDPDPAVTNREVLADLSGGAKSVWLRLGPGGLPLGSLGDALHNVHLDMAGVALHAGEHFEAAAEELLAFAAENHVDPTALRGNLGIDPIGVQARTGHSPGHSAAVELAGRCARTHPRMHAIAVDGQPYHDAGGSDAEELGCATAAGVAYLRMLTEAGVDINTAAGLLEFRLVATADQFGTIAKMRAARRMWDRVLRACGADEQARAQYQHAVTSAAMITRRDPWVNLLRTTVAAFAACVGGASAVTTRPYDHALGLPDSFSRRMARNTQALLAEESHLGQVIDPAGGSYYVETLSEDLARTAWSWFQRIEAEGGLSKALDSGLVADRLADTWHRRKESIALRSEPITGVSEFPDLAEKPLHRQPRAAEPETGGLPRHRYAEDYERLRDAADEMAEAGRRPRVFLATLGSLAAYNTRASFVRNLLAAGGIETVEAGETDTAQQVTDAFTESGSKLVCLCSSNEIYDQRAAETAMALERAGADLVLIARAPQDEPPEGVHGYLHAGSHTLRMLTDIHKRWGARTPATSGATS